MTKSKLIIVFSALFLILGIFLCGFKNSADIGSNNSKSIMKSLDFCNTLSKSLQDDNTKFQVLPDNTNVDLMPDVTPYQESDDKPQNVQIESKSATRNLLTGEVLIEQSSRRVLSGKNENARLYPASTTKVLTALCVLNSLPLDRVVTVSKEAAGVEGSSLYMKVGQKITVEDLLFGLMLRSGNDAAVALALETSGNVQDFATLMNETAKNCGAVNSNFVNPHGLHDENHYTTAYDLALITAKAYENPDFVRIVSSWTRKITVDGVETVIANKNKMLKLCDGANGVKTGFTKASGRCLVSGAKRGDMQLISVVLNCGDMWNESDRLLDFGFDNFEMVPIENALLTEGTHEIVVKYSAPVDQNWRRTRYPLRKDGSEKLVIKSQAF